MISITIDQKSMGAMLAGQIEISQITQKLELPPSTLLVKCVIIDAHGYVLSRAHQPRDGVLTISLKDDGPLNELTPDAREDAIGRMLRCASKFTSGHAQAVPMGWRVYHWKNRLSFQADRFMRGTEGGRTDAGRIVVDVLKKEGPQVFAFLLDKSGLHEIGQFKSDVELANDAYAGLVKAIATKEPPKAVEQLGDAVSLNEHLPERNTERATLNDWYNALLTRDQRRFVDHPMPGSVRLMGPAGSGKTIALVVKCLKTLHAENAINNGKRCVFLTHATSTATAIEEMILGMDPTDGLSYLAESRPALVVSTLYSLANEHMRYNLYQLMPVSLDGHEGRVLQSEVLNAAIEEFRTGDWITYRGHCSSPFVSYMEAEKGSPERRFFLWEILNEFACVLDAEGVRSGSERRAAYSTEKRKAWMMVLEGREEREAVLWLYDRFRTLLREMKAIGSDQMIADFLNHLDSYRWEAARGVEGFDAVFVDELHLFNRQERMVLRHLMRDPKAQPTVLMACDCKQSPRDTFLELPCGHGDKYNLWKDARLGPVEKIELVDVFRYSPEITTALSLIDEGFPGEELDSDWPPYRGIARTKSGPLPLVCTVPTSIAAYALTFKRARYLQQTAKAKRRVAVLCASNEQFTQYLANKELREYCYTITSRDEALSMPHSVRKFVFSMPEFVAGLQYDTVLLTEVNRDEVPDNAYATSALRKFASLVYLGASRAERVLEIYSSQDHGGIAPLLTRAVQERAIHEVDAASLRTAQQGQAGQR